MTNKHDGNGCTLKIKTTRNKICIISNFSGFQAASWHVQLGFFYKFIFFQFQYKFQLLVISSVSVLVSVN